MTTFIHSFVNQFVNEIFSIDGTVFFCKICEVKVIVDKKFTVELHISHIKHINGVKLLKSPTINYNFQRLITQPFMKSYFNQDLSLGIIIFFIYNYHYYFQIFL